MFNRWKRLTRLGGAGIILGAAALIVPLLPGTAVAAPTVTVNVELQAQHGILSIPANGSASYYADGWHSITTSNPNNGNIVQAEMQPGTYSFAATYNGTREQQSVTIPSTSTSKTVYFHVALVTVGLQAHNGSSLSVPDNGSASYYADGWRSITTPDPNNGSVVQAEMLPGTYSFAATYNGTREQQMATITEPNPNNGQGWNQTVSFQTELVNVELQAQHGILSIPANGSASYYADGWHSITTSNPNNGNIVQAEMLPGTYSFAATYNGTREQKTATINTPNPANDATGNAQTLYFPAASVTLLDSNGDPISGSYYANGWHSITTDGAEMLPGTYTFAATYNGTNYQESYTIAEPNTNNGAYWTQTVTLP